MTLFCGLSNVELASADYVLRPVYMTLALLITYWCYDITKPITFFKIYLLIRMVLKMKIQLDLKSYTNDPF